MLLLIDTRPPSRPPRRGPSRTVVEVVARLVLGLLLLAGASAVGGLAGVVAALSGVGLLCAAGTRALPYGRGLGEHRQ